jgi:hypothetical protein
MIKTVLVTLLFLIAGGSYAQTYFVLIRADNSQPFYVHIGGKAFSSSGQGHLIIPQLKDSSYSITVGFPKKLFPEQQFSFTITKKDLEFQLKNLGEKGWALFNPQTLELKMPLRTDTADAKLHPDGVRKDDAFSRLMAGVVSDTAVMYNTYALEEPRKDSQKLLPKADTLAAAAVRTGVAPQATAQPAKKDSSDMATIMPPSPAQPFRGDSSANPAGTNSSSISTPPSLNISGMKKDSAVVRNKTASVEKLSEQRTGTAMKLVYTDHVAGGQADTILIIIPVDPPPPPAQVAGIQPTPAEVSKGGTDLTQKSKGTKPVVVNSDCRNFAGDYDVDKLRLKMLDVPKDEDKLVVAKKIFRTKCFSTRQIRALSEVFTSDVAKFRFFETAYPFVSDDNYLELSSLLADPLLNGKFKAMTGH